MNTTVVKLSRELFNKIADSSVRGESRDQTLRRILGFEFTPKTPCQSTVIKITGELREFIRLNARNAESVDQTLRRLFVSASGSNK